MQTDDPAGSAGSAPVARRGQLCPAPAAGSAPTPIAAVATFGGGDDPIAFLVARGGAAKLIALPELIAALRAGRAVVIGFVAEADAQALAEHLQILDALERRDAEQASRLMAEHIRRRQAHFVDHFAK